MRSCFNNNAYLSAVKKDRTFRNDLAICEHAKNNPRFHYAAVDFDQFSSYYMDSHLAGGKLRAISSALWTGIALVVYHLAKALFIGLPHAIFCDNRLLKAYVFSLFRDLQECGGYLFSLFNEEFGAYHIQEAQFQKNCYDCFSTSEAPMQMHPIPGSLFSPSFPSATGGAAFSPSLKSIVSLADKETSPVIAPITRSAKDAQPGKKFSDFEAVKRIANTNVKENSLLEIADSCMAEGNLDQALKVIEEIYHDHKIKEKFFTKLAEAHFAEGDKNEALKVIEKIYHDHKTKEKFFTKLAEAHFAEGDKNEALKVIEKIYHDHKTKEKFFAKLAEAHFAEGDKNEALKVIEKIYHDHKTKEKFFAKLAEAHFAEGDKNEALKVIEKIYHDHKTKEKFFAKLAEAHFAEGDKNEALKVIKKISHDHKTKEEFFAKLAEAHFAEGDTNKAFEVAKEITLDIYTQDKILAKVAQSYYDHGDDSGLHQLIRDIARSTVVRRLDPEKVIETMSRSDASVFIQFFYQLGKDCCDQAKNYLAKNSAADAIDLVKQIAGDDKHTTAFLTL